MRYKLNNYAFAPSEVILLDESGFIERDPSNQNVRLTEPERRNCDKGIDFPPSDRQVRI